MKNLNISLISTNQTAISWENNKNNIINSILEVRNHSDLILFPELAISSYDCEDVFFMDYIYEKSLDVLFEILPYSKDLILAIGVMIKYNEEVYNSLCVMVDGKIRGFILKQNLALGGLHYENRHFKAWEKERIEYLELRGKKYPIGDLVLNIGGIRFGAEICQDAWVEDRAAKYLYKRGVDVILNSSASYFAFSKIDKKIELLKSASRDFKVLYLYSNLLGLDSGRVIYDGDSYILQDGNIIKTNERFSYKDYVINTLKVNIEPKNEKVAQKYLNLEFNVDFSWKSKEINNYSYNYVKLNKYEEFTKAATLALFDYLRKTKSNGFLVSLSGGADSSLVSVLVYLMIKLAIKELGLDEFKKKLSHINSIQNLKDEKLIVKNMLTCIYQASKNSSEKTFNSAKNLAYEIGAEFYSFEIDDLVDLYTKKVSFAINRELTWEKDDIALQNIQARTRSPLAWYLANIKNLILLATSNRSEASVGYATMDGDTSGGLSPIAGVDKSFIRKYLIWLENESNDEFKKLKSLNLVNSSDPSAELRPQEKEQKDEDDLMPYDILNKIENLFINDKLSPIKIFNELKSEKKYDEKLYITWIIRFFNLWSRNQWKRERYALSFHYDDYNIDPKSWFRFPVISGGFKEELEELNKNKV